MRTSYDSLFHRVKDVLKEDPFSCHLFVFLNKRRSACKCLYYDGTGLVLIWKRLEQGLFARINPFHSGDILLMQAVPWAISAETVGHKDDVRIICTFILLLTRKVGLTHKDGELVRDGRKEEVNLTMVDVIAEKTTLSSLEELEKAAEMADVTILKLAPVYGDGTYAY